MTSLLTAEYDENKNQDFDPNNGPIVTIEELASSNGSNLVGFIAAGAGAVTRTAQDKMRELVSARDDGAACDGAADDTADIQSLIDYLEGVGGGAVEIGNADRIYIAGTLTVKPGITLRGKSRHSVITQASGNYYNMGGQIKLGPAGKIVLQRGAGLGRLLVIRAGLYATVPANPAAAAAVVAAFAGTAVEANSADDAHITECMILGHAIAVTANNTNRLFMHDVMIDAQSGVYIGNSFDVCRLSRVHCWPFLTAFVAGVGNTPNDPAPLRRTGYGFKLESFCDWSTLSDCFEYGYARGYWLSSTSNVTLLRCSADYTNPNTGSVAGFVVDGTSTYTTINCGTIISTVQGAIVDTTGGAAVDSAVKITASNFANTAECIQVNNGNVNVSLSSFHSGTYGVSFAAGADSSSVNGCEFDGVSSDFFFASAAVRQRVARIGNIWQDTTPSATPERLTQNVTVQRDSATLALFDTSATAGGAGGLMKWEQNFAAGTQDAAYIKTNLVSGTAGNEAVALDFGVNRNGTVVYRVKLHHDGHWVPVTDNAVDNGQVATRWRNLYAATVRIGAGTVTIQAGTGSPEGVVTAVVGSSWHRTDGGAATSFYVKESGTGNTGWVAK